MKKNFYLKLIILLIVIIIPLYLNADSLNGFDESNKIITLEMGENSGIVWSIYKNRFTDVDKVPELLKYGNFGKIIEKIPIETIIVYAMHDGKTFSNDYTKEGLGSFDCIFYFTKKAEEKTKKDIIKMLFDNHFDPESGYTLIFNEKRK